MTENQVTAHQRLQACHGIRHREIGLRAVAAAVLYQGSNVERTISRELSAPEADATSSRDHET
jgi:hypothetical protein